MDIILCYMFFFFKFSIAIDFLTSSHPITDGNTLVSKDRSFEFGFFSPGSSKNRYLGIWYGKIPVKTVVWVANRSKPINDSFGFLMIVNSHNTSNLLLISKNKNVVWSSNSKKKVQSPIVQLLDSGNLVLRDAKDADPGNFLWQSFDFPCDTLLPGMKFGWDLNSGIDRRFSAWKSSDDPYPGDFTWGLEHYDYPEGFMWKGSKKYHRGGPWNGLRNSGDAPLKQNQFVEASFVSNEKEMYYIYNLKNTSIFLRVVLNQTVYSRQNYAWNQDSQTWKMYSPVPADNCDTYNLCGPYGNCVSTDSPNCECLNGFTPASPVNWNSGDYSQGCVRNNPIQCQNGEGFVRFVHLKLPDTARSWVNKSLNLKECRAKCLENCSCMAYSSLDIRDGGSGCAIWFGDLMDMRQSQYGQDLYIRMSAPDLEAKGGTKAKILTAIIATAIAICFGMLIIGYCIHRSRARLREKTAKQKNDQGEQEEDLELPLLELSTIAKATNNFSIDNKLGEGGFGPVYKGTLPDGQEIAVKRLSKSSGQGLREFKNEVILIAKLQHRNLVKLLGCCIQGDEKMLIYEYMPNKSLDYCIFDQTRSKQLDWSKRFNIVYGIARGLLYPSVSTLCMALPGVFSIFIKIQD